jgi:DNA-binding response OmpR family regulator
MTARAAIAIILNDRDLAQRLREYLDRRGHDVVIASELWAARQALSAGPDVVVVDLSIPGGSGLDLLRERATGDGPAFVVVAPATAFVEKVLALELGAADVVDAPFNLRETATRIGGILTRRGFPAPDLLPLENATVDLRSALVMHDNGDEDQLSPGQVAMLRLFASRPGRVISRDDIIAAAPAETYDAFDRSIDSRIVRLRRKLDTDAVVTVRGAGYRFDPPPSRRG